MIELKLYCRKKKICDRKGLHYREKTAAWTEAARGRVWTNIIATSYCLLWKETRAAAERVWNCCYMKNIATVSGLLLKKKFVAAVACCWVGSWEKKKKKNLLLRWCVWRFCCCYCCNRVAAVLIYCCEKHCCVFLLLKRERLLHFLSPN